ncbi:hypothetical protein [Reyranella sp.]|uniref:hypothetical protein n=1 Tax=Reyranella sp. TaxID=1929291 RepID=UPI00121E1D92|nr:hypothetical protein [Reyranella sp.]TAJ83348.1 MAG: hypothetical protein EPO50_23985 [Reyranella sp.]
MAARRLIAAMLGASTLAACGDPLPQPLYNEVTPPAAFRVHPGGVRIDNEGYQLDAEGYRVDKSGERVGIIDVPAKTAGDGSNAVAGYYISTTGQNAPGRVAAPSEGAGAGVGAGPGAMNLPTPSQMPQQAPITPAPGNVPPPAGYR